MHRSLVLAAPFVLLVACGGQSPDESLSSSEQELKRFGMEGSDPVRVSADSGVADTKPDTGLDTSKPPFLVEPLAPLLENFNPPPECTRVRYDIRTSPGRTCADLARTTSTGTWSVAPVFGDAPPEIRDTFCAATWLGSSPTCAPPDVGALELTCKERMWMVRRSPACAADPANCSVTATTDSESEVTMPPVRTCEVGSASDAGTDSGVIYGGIIGGCDSCAVSYGGNLFLTNPFYSSTVYTNIWSGGGYLTVSMPPNTTTQLTGYSGTNIVVWQ